MFHPRHCTSNNYHSGRFYKKPSPRHFLHPFLLFTACKHQEKTYYRADVVNWLEQLTCRNKSENEK